MARVLQLDHAHLCQIHGAPQLRHGAFPSWLWRRGRVRFLGQWQGLEGRNEERGKRDARTKDRLVTVPKSKNSINSPLPQNPKTVLEILTGGKGFLEIYMTASQAQE